MFIFMFEVCGESVLNTNLSIGKITILKSLSCCTETADQNSESLEFFWFFFHDRKRQIWHFELFADKRLF